MKAIIFGSTGAIGTKLVEILSTEHGDWEILAVTRSVDRPSRLSELKLKNVAMVEGDVSDVDDVLRLTQDADLIFSAIGFPVYEAKYWAKHWPVVVDNLLQATGAQKRLVFCDNLYAFKVGKDQGPVSPRSDEVEASLKGKPNIRALLHNKIRKHMEQNPGTVAVVGGADFFGPHITNVSSLGDVVPGKIVAGGSPSKFSSFTKAHCSQAPPRAASHHLLVSYLPSAQLRLDRPQSYTISVSDPISAKLWPWQLSTTRHTTNSGFVLIASTIRRFRMLPATWPN